MKIASLNTSNTTETAMVLRWLNDGYQRAVGMTGVFGMDASVSPSTGSDRIQRTSYAPATSVSQGVVTVKNVWLNRITSSSGTGRQLERVSVDEILRLRSVDSVSSYDGPLKYAVRGNGDIELWPVTASGNQFTVELDVLPLELVASGASSGQETSPSAFPSMFHRTVLANYAIARALQYRGLDPRAQYFMGEYENGVRELRAWLTEQGGVMGPRVRVRRTADGWTRYPDQEW